MRWAVVLLLVTCVEAQVMTPTYNRVLTNVFTNLIRRVARQTLGMENFPSVEDVTKNVTSLKPTTTYIRKHGLPAEDHFVTTGDGYILRIDRIPRPGSPVALLGNVLSVGSACFVALGPESIAAMLYDAGYDVWLTNWRGNGLSLGHRRLKSSQREFWNFGWHEHGTIDLPAIVDYILGVTREPTLTFVGLSMGSTVFMVMTAERPEYDRFINGAFLMGPVGDLSHHNNSVVLKLLHSLENTTAKVIPMALPGSDYLRYVAGMLCRFNVPSLPKNEPNKHCPLLRTVAKLMGGLGYVIYPVDIENYAPSELSLMEINHYAQLSNPGWTGFRKYNFGRRKNREIYGQDFPPEYDLTKSRIPIYLYTGGADFWTPPQAINALRTSFKNFRKAIEIPDLGHFDFVLNPTKAPVLYNVIIQDMKDLRKEQSVGIIGSRKRAFLLVRWYRDLPYLATVPEQMG